MPPDLLAAILANADDDLPRLVAADWFEEHGQPERAEFIRVQVELANINRTVRNQFAQGWSLDVREKVLIQTHAETWLAPLRTKGGPLHHLSSHGQFVRGFVETVWMTAANFNKKGEQLFMRTPVCELRVTRGTAKEIHDLISKPVTDRLQTLDLSNLRIGDWGVHQLTKSLTGNHLRRLRLRGSSLTGEGAMSLLYAPSRWNLDELDLRGEMISAQIKDQLRNRYGHAVHFSTIDRAIPDVMDH